MSRLRHSVPDWSFFKASGLPPADYYRRLREIGCEGVEMVDPSRRQAARDAGLDVLNRVGPGMREGLNRIENHAALLPEIRDAVRTAAEAAIRHVIIFSGNRNGQPDDEGLKNCIAGVEQVVGDAEKAGVTLVFEMLNGYDHPDYQGDRGEYGFALARALDSPAVKTVYDIYHMHRMGEDVIAAVTGNLDLIAHLHVAGSPKRDFPGPEQEIDYARIVPRIHAAGYRGFWGQEWKPGGKPLDELAEAVALFNSHV